ncbi:MULTISPECIES: GntR family transcriptional regulator [unclassified Streptomyces]|uniref:GntR family transcriptional regulator n=1 Tax=unclassified Streptomyces TaxID=2593676 RepID=UPI0035DECDDF
MEQGAARERTTETPSPASPPADTAHGEPTDPAGTPDARSARVPGQARSGETGGGAEPGPYQDTAPPPGGPPYARGEHTHAGPAGLVPRPVRRHSVRGQVLEALRTALVGGELVPGEVYSAPALAERFGVSATPVREAMQRLAVEGAVEVVPNRGFRVTERTPRELAELAEIRALIEVPVMLRLARTVPAARWAELRPLAEATATAAARGDRAHYAEADRAFHRAVLSLAGNQQLLAVADDLHRRSQWPLISAPAVSHGVLVADAAEHTALLDALIAQDLTVVRALVREHFTGSEC